LEYLFLGVKMRYLVSGKVNVWASMYVEANSKEEAIEIANNEFGGVSEYCGRY
jgi:hypothetical protein